MTYFPQKGIALITALLIVALASTAAVSITSQLQLEIRRNSNILHHDQAYIYALAAEDFARYGLKLDYDNNKTDHLDELWHTIPVAEEVEGGTLLATLDDKQGLFNLNNLANKRPIDQQRFQRLLSILELDASEKQTITATLTDWLDSDQISELGYGAEDDYYQGLAEPQRPYLAGNRLLSELSELRLIKGFSKEILQKLRITTQLDTETGEALPAIFTVLPEYTAININTAPAEVIKSLDNKMTDEIVNNIISKRRGKVDEGGAAEPFGSVGDFNNYLQSLSVNDVATEAVTVATSYFSLKAKTTIGQSQMNLQSILHRNDTGISTVVRRSQGVI
ncbi:MAG: type II secretion system minor pseudopilin GspK [Gammaproteobacteria bacterium]|nr:type II secretion system minor pseudopilin GspK [Gammaproteobacteria bacterium]